MFCPKCKKNTNHADLGDHLYTCLHCGLEHYKTAPNVDVSGGATPKPPYFDHQLAAAGEKRCEYET